MQSNTDDNRYLSVIIGEQEWMDENLNVEHFQNGDIILEAQTSEEWKEAAEKEQPAWCYNDNNLSNCEKYGKLYNWHAVHDPRGIAPKGWRVPTDDDWDDLTFFLESTPWLEITSSDANFYSFCSLYHFFSSRNVKS